MNINELRQYCFDSHASLRELILQEVPLICSPSVVQGWRRLIFHSHNDDNKCMEFKYSLLLTYTEPVNSQRCIVIQTKDKTRVAGFLKIGQGFCLQNKLFVNR